MDDSFQERHGTSESETTSTEDFVYSLLAEHPGLLMEHDLTREADALIQASRANEWTELIELEKSAPEQARTRLLQYLAEHADCGTELAQWMGVDKVRIFALVGRLGVADHLARHWCGLGNHGASEPWRQLRRLELRDPAQARVEVEALVAKYSTQKEIARQLRVSHKSVHRMMMRLGMRRGWRHRGPLQRADPEAARPELQELITEHHGGFPQAQTAPSAAAPAPQALTVNQGPIDAQALRERKMLLAAFTHCHFRIEETSLVLDIPLSGLRRRMVRLGIVAA